MDDAIVNRLTLVTLFVDKATERYVSAYADVQARVPGLTYETPIGQVEHALTGVVATIAIKPLAAATVEELASVK